MKKLSILVVILAVFLLACSSNKKEKEPQDSTELSLAKDSNSTAQLDSSKTQTTEPLAVVGADKDEHGCIVSAGYSWSVLKKKCIRTWETGIKLNQLDKSGSATFNASIILSENKKQVELFIHTEAKGLILDKIEGSFPTAYKAKDYLLTETPEGWTLSKGDKEIYNNF